MEISQSIVAHVYIVLFVLQGAAHVQRRQEEYRNKAKSGCYLSHEPYIMIRQIGVN